MEKILSFSLAVILLTLLMLQTCKKITAPLTTQTGLDTTSNHFTWTADTIYAEDAYQIYLYDIWGTDENNVWAVGHSEKTKYRIWHYDGTSWKNVYVPPVYHVPTYREIFGFSENDFWVVGYGVKTNSDSAVGYILHYDGEWHRMDNYDLPICLSVWGTSSENIYFGCFNGLIVKYNGIEFIKYETDKDIQFRCVWGMPDSNIFALGNKIVELGPNRFNSIGVLYTFKNNKFVLVDSADHYNKGFGMDLWGYDMDNFYSAIDGVYKYNNGQWDNVFHSSTIYTIYGKAPNNVFAGGYMTGLYHYNGNTWKKIENAPYSLGIWSIWCKDDYVFVIQDFGFYRIILKGKMIK